MSNRRRLKPTKKIPKHAHNGGEHVIHFCSDPDCPGDGCPNAEHDFHMCDRALDDMLALVQAEAAITCPVCGCDEHGYVKIGRQWLGESRFLCHCCHGCDQSAMASALIAQGFDPSTVPMAALCPVHDHDKIDAGMLAPPLIDEPANDKPTALYRWFDKNALLLYIGISDELDERVKGHIKASSWMEFAATSTIERHPTRFAALDAEEVAIKAERPLFNHQHNDTPEARKRAVEYLIKHNRLDLLAPSISRG